MIDTADATLPREPTRARLRYIDALRGVAALLVVWLHVANSYRVLNPLGREPWLNDFVSRIDIGRIGVAVFFLISGFVIPFSIKSGSAAPVAGFAIRRVFRIYPAYWLSVPLAALVLFWIPGLPFGVRDFLINMTLLQDVFGVPSAEGVYWTLLVEFAFYALCIALLMSRSLFSAPRIAILSGAFALVHVFAMFMLWLGRPIMSVVAAFWFVNLSVMLWGTLYRLAGNRQSEERLAVLALRGLGLFYVLVLPLSVAFAIHKVPNYALPYALAFLVFVAGTTFARIETRLTDWLGRISYSVYLFHAIVCQVYLLWLMRQPVDSVWRTQHIAPYLVANVVLTLIVASLVFRFVEQPAIRLGHRLAARLEGRGVTKPDATPARNAAPIEPKPATS
jgi:peptidoglycan/LPS O-acetylase OafA/YrhL